MVNKETIGLVTEDICALPEKIVRENQIEVVRTKLFFPEWEKFPEKNLYQVMAETKAYPKTSAPSPGDYLENYKKIFERFGTILVMTVSSKLSACYSSALEARQFSNNPTQIFIFDTCQAVAAQGLLVLKANQLVKEGRDIGEILKILAELRAKTQIIGFLKTTYWAEKTGRVTHWQGNAFRIIKGFGVQPMFGIRKGKVSLAGFNFWTKDTEKALFNQAKCLKKKYKRIKFGINYTDNIDLAYKLEERLKNDLKAEVMFISLVPPIVGANSGPGTLIIGYYYD